MREGFRGKERKERKKRGRRRKKKNGQTRQKCTHSNTYTHIYTHTHTHIHLGEQMGGVAIACLGPDLDGTGPAKGGESGYRFVLEMLLPLMQRLLNDSQEEVRLSTGESLCKICPLLKPEDR